MSGPSLTIGDYTVTAFSDGIFQTTIDTTVGVDKQMTQKISGKSLTDPVWLAVNAFLIEGKGIRALVDAGTGDKMGPSLGKLPENLANAGIAPDSISHPHPSRPLKRPDRQRWHALVPKS